MSQPRPFHKVACGYDISVQSFKDGGIAYRLEKSSVRGHLPRKSYCKFVCNSDCGRLETL